MIRADMASLDRAIIALESALEAAGNVPNEFIDALWIFMSSEQPLAFRIDRSGALAKNATETVVVRPQVTARFRVLLVAIQARDFNLDIFKNPDPAEHDRPT